MWKNIRKGAESFFGHVLHAAGKGFRIWFWHDPWSSPTPLKEYIQNCLLVLWIKKLGFLIWLTLHLMGVIEDGTYSSAVSF